MRVLCAPSMSAFLSGESDHNKEGGACSLLKSCERAPLDYHREDTLPPLLRAVLDDLSRPAEEEDAEKMARTRSLDCFETCNVVTVRACELDGNATAKVVASGDDGHNVGTALAELSAGTLDNDFSVIRMTPAKKSVFVRLGDVRPAKFVRTW